MAEKNTGELLSKKQWLPWPALFIFMFLAGAIAASGYIYYNKQKKNVIHEQITQLKTIADLKAAQIVNWLAERTADARLIARNPDRAAILSAFIHDRSSAPRRESVQRWLSSLQKVYHYENIMLLDRQGEFVLAASPRQTMVGGEGMKAIETARRLRDIVLSDLHSNPQVPHIHLDLVAPLIFGEDITGFVFLRVDPSDFLFPMIQSWPTPSPTAETLLVRRDGDSVLFLNELRHRKDTAMKLRIPISTGSLPATQAILGKTGSFAGNDYRGIPVWSVIRPVEGTSWFIVSKVDRDEIERPIRRNARMVLLAVLVLIMVSAILVLFLWQRQNALIRLSQFEALRESEDKFKHVFDNSMVGKSITLPDGEISVNKAFCQMLGYSAEELKARKWQELTHPDDVEATQRMLDQVISGKMDAVRFEKRFFHRNGSIVWVDVSTALRRDAQGKPLYFMTAVMDISEHKRAEDEIRALSARNQAMLEAVPDIIMEVDVNKVYTWANHAGIKFFGPDVIGHEAAFYFEGEQQTYLQVQPVFNGQEEVVYVESWQRRHDGEKRLLAWWCRVLKDAAGHVTGALSSARDITERKQAEDALRESERKFRETVVTLDEGYYSVTLDGKLLEHNQAFNHILGFETNKDLRGILLPDFWLDPERRKEYLKAFAATGSISNYQIEAKTQQGKKITVLASAHLVKDEKNRPQRIEGIFLDISKRIRAEAEIRRLNEELEQRVLQRTAQLEAANRELEAFSYSVSHDLRAPLRAIDGFSRIVLEEYAPMLDDEARRLLDVITANAHKMGHLIDDLLAFSRLSRQKIATAPVNLAVMAKVVFSELKIQEKGRHIEFKIGTLPTAHGDHSMLQQVLQNLLANAIKFTRTKNRARIELTGRTEKNENIFQVKDNGVGFDMQYASKLFGVFQRLHGSKEFEGTGVGLAIVQRIIARHGGRVWAESSPKGGTTFYFALPSSEGTGDRERADSGDRVQNTGKKEKALEEKKEK